MVTLDPAGHTASRITIPWLWLTMLCLLGLLLVTLVVQPGGVLISLVCLVMDRTQRLKDDASAVAPQDRIKQDAEDVSHFDSKFDKRLTAINATGEPLEAPLLTGDDPLSDSQTHRKRNEREATPLLGRGGLCACPRSFPSPQGPLLPWERRGSQIFARLASVRRPPSLQVPPRLSPRARAVVHSLYLVRAEPGNPGSWGRRRPPCCHGNGERCPR
ncbi:hypothetical protein NDU88_011255 [Pleurodeles waltl]|uniref:Uncharacterized protein n=1 Tax=Pleurodeles waltl TaxID=8319 RepID=A0AAV7S3C5_PLEWA|nr:hypothetical protein NDU88_011255 [Pleurodeles waltl]